MVYGMVHRMVYGMVHCWRSGPQCTQSKPYGLGKSYLTNK